mmetsp:Transcript_3533/g.7630  ORF Transcript_3533/g.7630 Transcript_3533/m.7630 type:complete len:202 (+) Transcript_3533:924-1529(+)
MSAATLGHRDELAAIANSRMQNDNHAVDVEEGENADKSIKRSERDEVGVGDLDDLRDTAAMGEHDALGQTCCARAVREAGELVGRHLHSRHKLRVAVRKKRAVRGGLGTDIVESEDVLELGDAGLSLLHLVEHGTHRREEGRARVVELVHKLLGSVRRVDCRHHAANVQRGMEGDEELGEVGGEDGQDIPLLQAKLRQART